MTQEKIKEIAFEIANIFEEHDCNYNDIMCCIGAYLLSCYFEFELSQEQMEKELDLFKETMIKAYKDNEHLIKDKE